MKSVQLLGSLELQSEVFQLAMSNPIFEKLFENNKNQPDIMYNCIPTSTDSALRKQNQGKDKIT